MLNGLKVLNSNEDVFAAQRSFSIEQKANLITKKALFNNFRVYFDSLLEYDQVKCDVWTDQDKGKHIVFITNDVLEDKERYNKWREKMSLFYNNTYCTGDICANTSRLVCSSSLLTCSVDNDEDATVDINTVVSFLLAMMPFSSDLVIMRYLCDFIYRKN